MPSEWILHYYPGLIQLFLQSNNLYCLCQVECVAINCFELTFIQHSHLEGIIFSSLTHKIESVYYYYYYHYILNDLKRNLRRHDTFRGTRKTFKNLLPKRFPHIISYDQYNLYDLCKAIRVMIINYWILVTGRDLLHSSGKYLCCCY